jgi:NADP-dependent 3-hydroxy acid dehydrogenase YdfG
MKAENVQAECAIVTGASSGIGRAISLSLAQAGHSLFLIGRDTDRLQNTADKIEERGGEGHVCRLDITGEKAPEKVLSRLIQLEKEAVLLVHSAGVYASDTTMEASLDEFDQLYHTNVRAPYSLTQALLPELCANSGQIVFVNSSIIAGSRAGLGQYASTKRALKGLTDALRAEVNPQGVRVLSVYPGRTATPMQKKIVEEKGGAYEPDRLLQPDDVASMIVHALSLPRTAEVTDIWIRPMQSK